MKIKYDRLTKEEKKIVFETYINMNNKNKEIMFRLNRSRYIFIIGMLYAIGMILYLLISKNYKIWEIITFSGVLLICFVLYLKSYDFKKHVLNDFIINNKLIMSKKIKNLEKK